MKIPEHISSRAAVNDAAFVLNEAGIGNARMEASWLLQHVLEHPPLYDERLDAAKYQEFFALVGQRAHRVPLQHVMGEMYFRGLKLRARPGVFVVRPETEWVAEAGIETAQVWGAQGIPPQVLDLGCGSGALGLAVAAEVADTVLTSVDISPEAVALTQENADLCGIKARVILADATDLGGLISALTADSRLAPHETDRKAAATEGECQTEAAPHESENNGANETKATPKFHVIVTNPPYVIETVTQPEAAADPPQALYGGGTDGLDIPRRFLENAAKLLVAGGTVVMEHGETQGEALVVAARDLGFGRAHIEKDLAGRPRFLRASEYQGL
ncbi:N5-glutamine methyltransferase family protein [Mobiluncus mulieris]|uniref:N5-glutamine methyltransferase family protein n=1 Tax=Mobiluncus mulieris TaxID=2052 RepID=UPI00242D0330|nr:HemK/PrmC family methyltransferase [Mobiluncus mulieris]